MEAVDHKRRVIVALERNEAKRLRDIKAEAQGILRPPRKKKCPIVLTTMERKMYTHCANCGIRVERHK